MKLKICCVISHVDSSKQFEQLNEYIDKSKYEIIYILMAKEVPALSQVFEKAGNSVYYIKYAGKKDIPFAIRQLVRIFKELKPDIVHTHLLDASMAGLIAGKISRIKQTVHTRHHSDEFHDYLPRAVLYDKFINRLSTHIIAISSVVAEVLTEREGVAGSKITVIPHGFKFEDFKSDETAVEDLRIRYELNGHFPVVGAISRFIHWKGLQYTIPAFKMLLSDYPDAKLVLANAVGNYSSEVRRLLNEHLEEKNFVVIEFEKQSFALFKTFDVFVHVPITRAVEAYGQVYVEALAMGIPSVMTLSGIANDFLEDQMNAMIVPHKDSESIYKALKLLLSDADLRRKLARNGVESVSKLFHAEKMATDLGNFYDSISE